MFLTDLDSRAGVKGSRDPLGLVPLWGLFGRHVVGNLTTVTTSVRGFTTVLLGYHFVKAVQDIGGDGQSPLRTFIKLEQLVAYARCAISKDEDFRGLRKVKRLLAEGKTAYLSAEADDQVLSDQKVYGLWGLYSSPSRASGLVERDEAVLTPVAHEFVERTYIAALEKDGLKDAREIVDLLRQARPAFDVTGRHAKVARAVARLMTPNYSGVEREFYREHLVLGGPGNAARDLQTQLAGLMGKLPAGSFGHVHLLALRKEAHRRGAGHAALAHRLSRICHLESLLAPAAAVFDFVLVRHRQTVASVAKEIRAAWGSRLSLLDVEAIRELRDEIAQAFGDSAAGVRFIGVAEAFLGGDYAQVVKLLLEQNAFIMQARGGSAAWVRMAAGRLDVRFRDETAELPKRSEVAHLWRHNYFLESLNGIVHALREA